MPDGQMRPVDRLPILMLTLGRQRVGKTTLLNATAQYFRAQGNPIQVWNADQQNRSHALSTFFADAEEVPNGGLEDGKAWIEDRISDLIKHRYDAVLDVGGGATGFSRLVQEVPVLDAMEGSAIRMVGLFCIGPEKADLDYLEQFADVDGFMPAASVIVLNSGLITSGRSAGGAFKPILEHQAIKSAVKRGAKVAIMPALSCMAAVTDRGLTFADAMNGGIGDGDEPLSLFDRARVNKWWSREMPEFFSRLPSDWLPLPSGPVSPAESEAG